MTVTPVLADQLEDAGAAERLRRVPRRVADRGGRGRRARGAGRVPRTPARRSWTRYRHALELLDAAGGDPLRPFREAAAEGRVALAASAATHAVLPLLATRGRGCGCSSTPGSARTGGASAGTAASGCRSAPTRRGSSGGSPSTACAGSASTRAPTSDAARRAGPGRDRGRAGGAADRLGGDPAGSGRSTATRPTPPTPSSPANRCAGSGSGRSAAAPTTRPRPRRRRGARRASSSPPSRARLRDYAAAARAGAACSSSRSTPSCSATGGRRAPIWLREVLAGAAAAGVRLLTVPEALAEHEPVERPLRRLDLGRGQGPPHLGLAAGRRPRLGRAAAGAAAAAGALARAARRRRRCAPRASCSPSRPATGPSSTGAARRATTPSSARPTTPRRRSRP